MLKSSKLRKNTKIMSEKTKTIKIGEKAHKKAKVKAAKKGVPLHKYIEEVIEKDENGSKESTERSKEKTD